VNLNDRQILSDTDINLKFSL